ncbi:putative tRNA pseudouridine synthase 2 [Aphelenchoides besseyi]|nr:putative tRNA pseudouridine synthase 2 [Aphelenchoides besseyi]
MKWNLSCRDVAANLNGFLCVYKPRDVSLAALKKNLMKRLSTAGNSLEHPRPPLIEKPIVKPHKKTGALMVVGMRKQVDYSLHPLVYGMTFRPEDILLDELEPTEVTTSGVCLFAVNEGCERLEAVRELAWANEYILTGVLGEKSDKNLLRSKVVMKAKYDHVNKILFEKKLSKLRHQYRRLSYELANVDIQSEEAFELASEGKIRPKVLGSPVLYDIQLLNFHPPWFQLKVISVCENDEYLRLLVNQIAVEMKTLARPTRIQRLRIGPFQRPHALLDKYFQLPNVIKNIKMCNRIIDHYLGQGRGDLMSSLDGDNMISLVNDYNLTDEKLQIELERSVNDELEDGDSLRIAWGRSYD